MEYNSLIIIIRKYLGEDLINMFEKVMKRSWIIMILIEIIYISLSIYFDMFQDSIIGILLYFILLLTVCFYLWVAYYKKTVSKSRFLEVVIILAIFYWIYLIYFEFDYLLFTALENTLLITGRIS